MRYTYRNMAFTRKITLRKIRSIKPWSNQRGTPPFIKPSGVLLYRRFNCSAFLFLADVRKIPMGVLVEELSHSAEDLITAVNNMKKYTRKLSDIEDMAVEEIIQVYFLMFVIRMNSICLTVLSTRHFHPAYKRIWGLHPL